MSKRNDPKVSQNFCGTVNGTSVYYDKKSDSYVHITEKYQKPQVEYPTEEEAFEAIK